MNLSLLHCIKGIKTASFIINRNAIFLSSSSPLYNPRLVLQSALFPGFVLGLFKIFFQSANILNGNKTLTQ